MKLRLLIIYAISILCTSMTDDVADVHNYEASAEIQYTCISDTIDSPEQVILVPRQTECATHTQTRTAAKRYPSNRLMYGYVAFITYQLTFKSISTGLLIPYRHYLSLGRLII